MLSTDNTYSRPSYNAPEFKPFQSGCSLCYPSTDYTNTNTNTNRPTMQYGGSNKSLISNLPGKNLYKPVNYSVPVDKLIKDNFGISYKTSAGGSKNNAHKVKINFKKNMKGGLEDLETNSEESLMMGGKKKKTTKKNVKGGAEHNMMSSEESSMMGGKKKKTTKKNVKGGAEHHMMSSEESSMMGGNKKKTTKKNLKGGAEHNMMSSEESSMMGGKKKKTTKKNLKGGENHLEEHDMMGGKKSKSSKKTTKKNLKGGDNCLEENSMNGGKKKKTTKKNMKGGEESWGATGMPIQFYDPKAPLANYPFNSGLNAKSAYGPVDPKDVGVGMLAPMNTSKNAPVPIMSQISQTGGKKKSKLYKNKKGGNGSDFISTLNSRGPSNAPDMYWGIDGEKWFRQFNKTANYIPNSQLAKAATPKLLEGPKNDAVIGYNAFSDVFAPVKGGKSKAKAKPKSKTKSKAKSKAKPKH